MQNRSDPGFSNDRREIRLDRDAMAPGSGEHVGPFGWPRFAHPLLRLVLPRVLPSEWTRWCLWRYRHEARHPKAVAARTAQSLAVLRTEVELARERGEKLHDLWLRADVEARVERELRSYGVGQTCATCATCAVAFHDHQIGEAFLHPAPQIGSSNGSGAYVEIPAGQSERHRA